MAADRDNYGKLSLTYSWTFVSQPSGHCPQAHIACVEDFCNNQNYFTDGDYSLGLVFRASALLVAPENVCAPTVYPVIRDKSKPTTVGCTPVGPPASGRNAAALHGRRPSRVSHCCPMRVVLQPNQCIAGNPCQQCQYEAVSPTQYFVGNSAYFTPKKSGTYQIRLKVRSAYS